MGKLAERLSDAQRSGVYRIETIDALEEAVALNGFALVRIALDSASSAMLGRAAADAAGMRTDGLVLLFAGCERLSQGALDPLLAQLESIAVERRKRGMRFFAAFLDPSAGLALAPLYNWHRGRSARRPEQEIDQSVKVTGG